MSIELVQLRGEDFEDAIDFMNLVFGAHGPIDFAQLLPALYQPTDEHMGWNWAVREDGRIRAVVGSFPMQWHLGETTLEMAGIGGVSSHPRARGAGYMRQLMQHCVERMHEEKKQLSWLGGQRQRYGYFGYEKCGTEHSFSLDKTNLRHVYGSETSSIHFRELQANDRTHIQGAIELHSAQPFRCLRASERFHSLLCSWHHRPHIALAPDGRMIGYLVANQSGDLVSELFAVEEGQPDLQIARAWVEKQSGNSVRFELEPWHRLVPQLGQLAESFSTNATGNWQIFDWVSTLDALMKVRATMGPLVAGEVVIEIEGYGVLALQAEGESARCSASTKPVDLIVDAFTAHRLLCGPLPPSRVMALPTAAAVLGSWCPLPLAWTKQDGV